MLGLIAGPVLAFVGVLAFRAWQALDARHSPSRVPGARDPRDPADASAHMRRRNAVHAHLWSRVHPDASRAQLVQTLAGYVDAGLISRATADAMLRELE